MAYLEDRILVYQGKEQIYGSQMRYNKLGKYEFYPIMDEINVDKRRAAVNLELLEDSATDFGVVYTLPKKKK